MAVKHKEEGAKLSFDLTKQFVTIAVGGIAFVVGLSYSTPTAISSVLLWITVTLFGLSAAVGLTCLMHGVYTLLEKESFDVYATGLRVLSTIQIICLVGGVAMLGPILYQRPTSKIPGTDAKSIQLQLGNQQTIAYPVEAEKNYIIQIENGNARVESTR